MPTTDATPSSNQEDTAGADAPLVELNRWEARFGATKKVHIPAQGELRVIAIRIPAGVKNNARLRLRGQGPPDPAGGRPGDFFVRVRINTWRTVLHLLAASVALAGVIGGAGVFAVGLVGIWGLILFCAGYTRKTRQHSATAQGRTTGQRRTQPRAAADFRYNLCAFGILYLIPIGIALAFYVLLTAYISYRCSIIPSALIDS